MKIYILFILLISSFGFYSQNESNNDTILEKIDVLPEFKGGQAELYKFLSQNIKYPQECINHGVEGKVYVKFIVMKNGSIKGVQIIKSAHRLLDEEAARVIESMPNWTPGIHNGKPVNVYFTLPINFTLDNIPVNKNDD